MAKREIPEINAGSMADIAFLLLIFFLVTTTMDKDTAFLRTIPKKVENPPPPSEIEKRNIFSIKANNNSDLLVRGELMRDADEISERIVEFYRMNEKQNDPTNNYPMYSSLTAQEIEDGYYETERKLEEYENAGNTAPEILAYVREELAGWEKRRTAINTLGGNVFKQVAEQAHIRVEMMKFTRYELMAKIHTEIQQAIYELKSDAAKRIWNASYDAILNKVDGEPGKHVMEENMKKCLDLLYDVRIIEVKPK